MLLHILSVRHVLKKISKKDYIKSYTIFSQLFFPYETFFIFYLLANLIYTFCIE